MSISLTALLILVIVAGVCGAIGRAIAGDVRGGIFTSIAIGFVGALLGMWLAHALHLPELFVLQVDGRGFPIIWSVIGSALFVGVLSLLTRRRRW